ncbi:DUF3817 domain-containing protein [Leptospira dzoumogneensis]|uniref:DUF3817 domain-containing protein n=1 Tax=Leptospira dzoumogneensis TaxID=2484904 RepID=A0A4Z1B3F6_9LEPT|nr:DUF3817 domain-containing protein [Leptospira dzoumogneensis]TGN04234.1 DUF3817 domain-containing protein [Leptospira dzoumogneensis]
MRKFFTTDLGRLRLVGFLEGTSLLILIILGMPLKYYFGSPELVKLLGPIHGGLFLLFLLQTFHFSIENSWSFKERTWKVALASVFPFGTFYIDSTILRKL